MKRIKSWLPIFPGFYETGFDSDEESEIYQYNQEYGTNKVYEDFEFDYSTFRTETATAAVKAIAEKLNDLGFDMKLKFDSIYSPKEYNFTNDNINASFYFKPGTIQAIRKYIKDNYKAWETYIHEQFTSYDGFMSFESNDGKEWFARVTISEMLRDFQVAGVVLEFILRNEKYTTTDLMYGVADTSVYLSYEVKEFEFYELEREGKETAIRLYRTISDLGNYAAEIEIVEAIENEEPTLKFDYSGNCLNKPGLSEDPEDPNQLKLF